MKIQVQMITGVDENDKKRKIEDVYKKICNNLNRFDQLTQEEYKQTILDYISCIASKYSLEDLDVNLLNKVPNGFRGFAIPNRHSLGLNKKILQKPFLLSKTFKRLSTISHEIGHCVMHEHKAYSPFTREDGLYVGHSGYDLSIFEIFGFDFFGKYISYEKLAKLAYLPKSYYWHNKDEKFARQFAENRLQELVKTMKTEKRKLSKIDKIIAKKNIAMAKLFISSAKADDALETAFTKALKLPSIPLFKKFVQHKVENFVQGKNKLTAGQCEVVAAVYDNYVEGGIEDFYDACKKHKFYDACLLCVNNPTCQDKIKKINDYFLSIPNEWFSYSHNPKNFLNLMYTYNRDCATTIVNQAIALRYKKQGNEHQVTQMKELPKVVTQKRIQSMEETLEK